MDQRSNTSGQTIDATRDKITDTLTQGKDRVKDAMADVKANANDTVEQAKQMFDINQQMQDRPWIMLGASVAAGYVLGSLGGDDSSSSHSPNTSTRYNPQGMSNGQQSQPGMLSDVMDQFRDEFDMLKGAAITTLTNMLRDTLKNNVPQFADEFERARSERDQQTQTGTGMSQSSQPINSAANAI